MPCYTPVPDEYIKAADFERKHSNQAMDILCSMYIQNKDESKRIGEWIIIHKIWDIVKKDLFSKEAEEFLIQYGD